MSNYTVQPDCVSCSLNRKMVKGYGNQAGKYLIIIDQPSLTDLREGEILSGFGGTLLKRIFKALGVDEDELYFASLLMCRPPNRDATDKEFSACEGRLFSEILAFEGDNVLICGGNTVKRMFDTSLYYKRSLPFQWRGKRAICTYSPNYILKSPEHFIDLCEDVKKLVHPEYIKEYDEEELSKFQLMQTEEEVYRLLSTTLASYSKLSFDIETTGLNPKTCALRCIGIGNEKECYIIPAHLFTDKIKRILEWLSRRVPIIAHFANFEYKWMFALGCDIKLSGDTILKHHEIDERKLTSRKLKWLGTRYFNAPNWADILKESASGETLGFAEVPEELLYPYLAHDIKITDGLDTLFDKHPECPPKPLYEMIMRGRRVLSKMSHYGIRVDRNYLFELYHLMDSSAQENITYLQEVLENEQFNPRSSRMVAKVLFEELGMPKIDGESTGKKVMHQLRHRYPEELIISKIDDTRKLLSAQSTFVRGIYRATDPETSMMHGEFMQSTAATGRLSSIDPNLQNIQRKGEVGKLIRNALIPPEGYDYIVEGDYSQIEVYFAAIESGDKNMLELLANGGDIYRTAASEFFGKPKEEITDLEREYFKPIILGSLYLRGAAAIAEQNHTSVAEEQAKQDLFFKMYPDYYAHAYGRWTSGKPGTGECYFAGALERAKRDKAVTTRFGRKRRFPVIFADNQHEVRREALNATIQGTASDVCFNSLITMYETAEEGNFLHRFRPWNIIHDACLAWITEDFKEECKPFMKNIMLNPPIELPIQLKVDFKIGKRWGEMEKW